MNAATWIRAVFASSALVLLVIAAYNQATRPHRMVCGEVAALSTSGAVCLGGEIWPFKEAGIACECPLGVTTTD